MGIEYIEKIVKLINEVETNVKIKHTELVEAFNMLDKLWERKDK